ncbi:MAG TPA: hypothetical protein VEZ17_04490 [Chitinophagaceae bacterium]|nr:hypothetical protein [Chitinophagaceae bacterium]
MNLPLLIANILVFVSFFIHVIMGDREIKMIQPSPNAEDYLKKQEIWTMARGAFHIIGADVFCLNILLTVIVFTDYISNEKVVLNIVAILHSIDTPGSSFRFCGSDI